MFNLDLLMLNGIQLNAKFILGLILFAGLISARVSRKMHAPQVVGYIIIGIILGQSGFNIINKDMLASFVPFNHFALGIIGFMIGGELKKEVLHRYGKQFITILLTNGLITFLAVFLLVGAAGTFLMGNGPYPWALAMLLGAIASATAPATITEVLRENRSRGPLTTTVMGVMAMDNSLALVLFALAGSVAAVLLGTHPSVYSVMARAAYQIGIGIIAGLAFSHGLIAILKQYAEKDKILAFSLCGLLLAMGSAMIMRIDMLIMAMTMGAVLANREQRLSKDVFKLISGFTMPFYVLFFVLVGAKFDIRVITLPALLLALVYLAGRTFGKTAGTSLGAKKAGADKTVQKYLPYCFLSQAGFAVGLSILAFQSFPGVIGDSIAAIITIAILIAELAGPSFVKHAVVKAGEAGLDINEEELMRQTKVGTIMDKNPPVIYEKAHLKEILQTFCRSSYHNFPVVNRGNNLRGIITIESIRKAMTYTAEDSLLIAYDIMEPVPTRRISPESSLFQAVESMEKYGIDYLAIVNENSILQGFMEKDDIEKFVSSRLVAVKEILATIE